MAKTSGHGNPNWSREEIILALDLYFDCAGKVPSANDDRMVALSKLLQRLPAHANAVKRESFRNPDGVAFKVQNLRQVATGKGLGNVSQLDRQVWEEFGHDPAETKQTANIIRATVSIAEALPPEDLDEAEFAEGSSATYTHRRRERSRKIRQSLIEARRQSGSFHCDLCKLTASNEAAIADAIFEAHHVVPLSQLLGVTATKLKDMALLCANCHRLMHRLIVVHKRWIGVDEARTILALPCSP